MHLRSRILAIADLDKLTPGSIWRGCGARKALRKKALGMTHGERNAMSETILDLMGLKCPLPALKTRKALKAVPPGGTLLVWCTDPMAEIDIPNLMRETGDALVATERQADRLVFSIRKA
jgi:tRNA 2-thiouridine synthesizing protein A